MKIRFKFQYVLFLSALLGSCSLRSGTEIKRHDLFSIPLGVLPGELDWFYRDSYQMAGTTDIQTRDGLVYLSGGSAGKIMIFNSYGDLITYVYDPEKNSPPAANAGGRTNSSVSAWSFQSPGTIAAFDGGFLVEDEAVAGEIRSDSLYNQIILRFSQDGEYLGHLGRDGYGGAAFPDIKSIDIREDGGIVVTCQLVDGWTSYWFDSDGLPVTTVRISNAKMPGTEDGGNAVVYSVRPDPSDWVLYFRVDIYSDPNGQPDPRLYTLDMSTMEYSQSIQLNYSESIGTDPEVPPEYLGTTVSGNHMMMTPEGPDQYKISVIDSQGRILQNRRLSVDASSVVYRRFRLQNNGLLTGIFFGPGNASVSWWRTDRLTGEDH